MRITQSAFPAVIILGLLLFASCKHEPEGQPVPQPEDCDTFNITYNASVYPIFQQYCISCHSGASPDGGIDLNDYQTVSLLAQTGALFGAMNHTPGYSPMPQGGPKLSNCDIATIRLWIRDTTFVDPNPTGNPCDPDTVYFQNDVLPILLSSCGIAGCHDAVSMQDGVNLTNYASVIQTGKIKPFDPNDSELYEVITENDPDKIMPPPPKSPLTSSQIQTIYKWIMQGALNNSCTSTDCDTINVTFSGTIWPIIQNNCFGCHSGSNPEGGISLENYSDVAVVAGNGRLLGSVKHLPGYSFMPKNGFKLSDCKIKQIEKWIENGYPNN